MLLGSTQKMGTGTNVQKRLVALHHLDAPWKPAEVEQREGRILRQGNENEEVAIYRYVTEGSFDAYMWQALETKARFIAQVMTGDNAVRRAEDIGGQELSYAEVKAIASGNPAVLTLAEADAELQRLAILKKNHADEQYLARRKPARVARATSRGWSAASPTSTQDMATAKAHADDPITIGERTCKREEALELLGRPPEIPARRRARDAQRPPRATIAACASALRCPRTAVPEVFVEGARRAMAPLSRDHHGPRAILNAVERLVGSYDAQCDTRPADLAIAQDQLRDYQARLGAPFPHDAYLTELTGLRDQLKAALSITTPDPAAKPLPPAHELADQIKALKAAHTIEAAPQRLTARSAARAEEPIAARIRHRVKESARSSPEEDTSLPAAAAQPSPRAASTAPTQPGLFEVRRPPAPAKPRTFHQEHVSPDKRTPKRQMRLF